MGFVFKGESHLPFRGAIVVQSACRNWQYNDQVYKVIHRESGEEIISLSPTWRKRLNELRALDQQDVLACPSCRQSMRLKAGKRRRPHFAHKHLKGCSFGNESPAVVEARGALYERLIVLFPGAVELEKPLPGADLPRPLDLFVKTQHGAFAVWVIDATLKLEVREHIRSAFAQAGLPVVWVLCAKLLHPDEKTAVRIRLSPTERDFLRRSPFDEIGRESHLHDEAFGSSLHYLDSENDVLTSFRSLERVHAPNVFSGRKESHPLAQVMLDPRAPDFFHPGEVSRLQASRNERTRRAERIQRFLGGAGSQADRGEEAGQRAEPEDGAQAASRDNARQRWGAASVVSDSSLALCVHCGAQTEDWWQAWWQGDVRYCKCRSCLEKGLE